MAFTYINFAKEVQDEFSINVGKGELSLWCNKWSEVGLLCDRVPYVHIQDISLNIKDIIFL